MPSPTPSTPFRAEVDRTALLTELSKDEVLTPHEAFICGVSFLVLPIEDRVLLRQEVLDSESEHKHLNLRLLQSVTGFPAGQPAP